MGRKNFEINWKKVLTISVGPFILLCTIWLIINPPWWLRNSPSYTLQLIKDKNYPGGENYHKRVFTPFKLPEIPTSTRPLLLFQIYQPGNKYSVLWAYDYIARNKFEFAQYKRHPQVTPTDNSIEEKLCKEFKECMSKDNGNSLKIRYVNKITSDVAFSVVTGKAISKHGYLYYPEDVYTYDGSNGRYVKLYSTMSYGECSDPIFWDKDKHEVYALSSYPVSSEEYITNYCIIDDRTGKIITKLNQPRAMAKDTYMATFDEASKRLLTVSSGENGGTYLVDFLKKRITLLKPGFRGKYYPVHSTHIASKIVLLSMQCEGYVIYDIQSGRMSSIHQFPDNECREPISYPYQVSSISPSKEYILFARNDSINDTDCYLLTDYPNEQDLDYFCDDDDNIGGLNSDVRFDGWEEG